MITKAVDRFLGWRRCTYVNANREEVEAYITKDGAFVMYCDDFDPVRYWKSFLHGIRTCGYEVRILMTPDDIKKHGKFYVIVMDGDKEIYQSQKYETPEKAVIVTAMDMIKIIEAKKILTNHFSVV
jgi:hypothetical protein